MSQLLAEQPDGLLPLVHLFRQFLTGEQMDRALLRKQHALCSQCGHRGVFGAGQGIGFAEPHVIEGVLHIQVHTEAAVLVQFAVLLVEVDI